MAGLSWVLIGFAFFIVSTSANAVAYLATGLSVPGALWGFLILFFVGATAMQAILAGLSMGPVAHDSVRILSGWPGELLLAVLALLFSDVGPWTLGA